MGGNPVGDSLLGIKYIITESSTAQDSAENELYERLYTRAFETEDGLVAYENPYALSILYLSDAALFSVDLDEYQTPFDRLNAMATAMLGSEEPVQLFRPIEYEIDCENCTTEVNSGHQLYVKTNSDSDASVTLQAKAPMLGEYYFFTPSDYPREMDLTLNGSDLGTYFDIKTRCILDLGTFEADQNIVMQMKLKEDDLYLRDNVSCIYYLDEALLNKIMPALKQKNITVTAFDDTHITGTFSTKDASEVLCTSIPYDAGWHVSIDGQKMPITRALNALLAVDTTGLSAGEHTVSMYYMPDCIVLGAGLTVLGIALFALTVFLEYLYQHRKRN